MDLSLKRGFRETLAATWYKESLEVSGYIEKILKESNCEARWNSGMGIFQSDPCLSAI